MLVQQADFQHVVNAGFDLKQVKRFGNEVFGAGLQRALFLAGLGGNGQNGRVAVSLNRLEALHDLKTIHARHLKVQQDKVIGVCLVQGTDFG